MRGALRASSACLMILLNTHAANAHKASNTARRRATAAPHCGGRETVSSRKKNTEKALMFFFIHCLTFVPGLPSLKVLRWTDLRKPNVKGVPACCNVSCKFV